MKTEKELIVIYPYLNNLELSAQDEAGCAEACLVVANSIIRIKKIESRGEFQAELSKVYLDRLRNETTIGLRDLPSLKRQAKDLFGINGEVKNISDFETYIENDKLFIARLRWSKFESNQNVHRYIDDEHYVLVYRVTEDTVFFWEPSFSFNGKKTFKEKLAENSRIRAHLSYSSPFWEMPRAEFIQRIKKASMIPSQNKEFLVLKFN